MTDTSTEPRPANARWVIAVAGRDDLISVEAATITQHHATDGESVHIVGGSHHDVILTTLRDADGQIVFQAPALGIAYIRRSGAADDSPDD